MNIRIVGALILGIVLGMVIYAALRGDLTPDNPAFEGSVDPPEAHRP